MAASIFLELRECFQPQIITFKGNSTCGEQMNLFISITKSQEIENFRMSDSLGQFYVVRLPETVLPRW